MKITKKLNVAINLVIMVLFVMTIIMTFTPISQSEQPPADDEREESIRCPDGQHIGIFCMEGKIDCTPRDCPYQQQ